MRAGTELAVEFVEPTPERLGAERLAVFRRAFDEDLKRQNADYTTKRTEGFGMGDPVISPLPVGTFHGWLQAKGKLGGQHKCPRCANARDIIESVKAAAVVEAKG